LEQGTIDLATCLTEGILSAISAGHRCRLHSLWVESPLEWGIHVAADSPVDDIDALGAAPSLFAISRPGSGSELMALVLADQRKWGWKMPAPERFVTVQNIAGAVDALAVSRTAHGFLWNKSMTTAHPQLRRIGEILTPWPSFVVVVGSTARELLPLIDSIVLVALTAARFFLASRPEQLIQARYGLDPALTSDWVRTVTFGRNAERPTPELVREVVRCMKRVGRIKSDIPITNYLAPKTSFGLDLIQFKVLDEPHETIVVGGISVYAIRADATQPSPQPLRALFLLHGRTGSLANVLRNASELARRARSLHVPLIVLIVEQRNHGQRMLDSQLNGPMSGDGLEMFANLVGTAHDASFVIDVLPTKLAARGERISHWGVVGISMGGHSSLVLAARDARLNVAVSLIGCGDYASLLADRLATQRQLTMRGDTLDERIRSVIGGDLFDLIAQQGALSRVAALQRTKLLLVGASGDPLVSPRFNERFLDALRAAQHPSVTVHNFDVNEHTVSPAMWNDATEWLVENFFSIESQQ
jgi:sulfonate transport system substrate-binding protein